MAKKDLQYSHYATVIDETFYFEKPEIWAFNRKQINNKRVRITVEEVSENITTNQFAFYFGGIIRSECMNSECFKGCTENEISDCLFEDIRSYTKTVIDSKGNTRIFHAIDKIVNYTKEDMRKFIEELIPHLAITYNIHVKDPEYYKLNKYIIKHKKR